MHVATLTDVLTERFEGRLVVKVRAFSVPGPTEIHDALGGRVFGGGVNDRL